MIFGQQRDQFRRVFVDAWRKHRQGGVLEPMEHAVVGVIAAHPEYHEVFDEPDALVRDYPPEHGQTNPFLHMAMHIAIVEQLASDRPAGIRSMYENLRERYSDTHELEHAMMECLSRSLEEAREHGGAPDEQRYLACVHRLRRRVL